MSDQVSDLSLALVPHHAGDGEVDKLVLEPSAEVGEDNHCSHVGQQSPLLGREGEREKEKSGLAPQRGEFVRMCMPTCVWYSRTGNSSLGDGPN